MKSNAAGAGAKAAMRDEKRNMPHGERRSGLERRQFTYTIHLPERRTGEDRRSAKDRRSGEREERGSHLNY